MEEWRWVKDLPPELYNIVMTILALTSFVVLISYFFYVSNLTGLLKAVRPGNRKVAPWKAWLLLFGFLNYGTELLPLMLWLSDTAIILLKYLILGGMLLWQVYMSYKIQGSIKAEFDSRGIAIEEVPTWKWAVNYCLAMLMQVPVALHLPGSIYFSLVWLWVMVSWISYWIVTAKYRRRLSVLPADTDSESQVFGNLY